MNAPPDLQPHKAKLQMNAQRLETKALYVCFRNDDAGRRLRDRFNLGQPGLTP
jgi:hypothetical protein